MKRILCALGLLWSINGLAQVTHEHTIELDEDQRLIFIGSPQVTQYMVLDKNQNKVEFYNADYSFRKSSTIDFTDFWLLYLPSQYLFNTDDKVEFIETKYIDGEWASKLYNEDGTLLHDFEDGNSFGVFSSEDKIKLIAKKDDSLNREIYVLDGDPSILELPAVEGGISERIAYPNPAQQNIHLTYQLNQGETALLEIFDINGQKLEERNIGSYFTECLIDVSSYPKGTYFYSYNGISKKFVVQ